MPGEESRQVLRRDLHREFWERTGKDISMLNLDDFLHAAQRLGVFHQIPVKDLEHVQDTVLQQDLIRLTARRVSLYAELSKVRADIASARSSVNALDIKWMEQDQFEAPDANQAFFLYNQMRTSFLNRQQRSEEELARVEAELEQVTSENELGVF